MCGAILLLLFSYVKAETTSVDRYVFFEDLRVSAVLVGVGAGAKEKRRLKVGKKHGFRALFIQTGFCRWRRVNRLSPCGCAVGRPAAVRRVC